MDSAEVYGFWEEPFFASISFRASALRLVFQFEPATRYRLPTPNLLDEDWIATSLLHAETGIQINIPPQKKKKKKKQPLWSVMVMPYNGTSEINCKASSYNYG